MDGIGSVSKINSNPLTQAEPGGSGSMDDMRKTKFGDVWNDIQAKHGAKAEKPVEKHKTLDKDDFMKLMVTQMKFQDPTKPFDADRMMGEIAQITSVEQMQNVNKNLTKLIDSQKPAERLSMTHLIGRTVSVNQDRFPHTEGQNENLNFSLPKDAKEVRVSVVSEEGEVIYYKDIGSQKNGPGSLVWDGVKSNTTQAKNGVYMVRVEAKDENGSPIPINNVVKAKVVGVSFEGGQSVFLVGDPQRPSKVAMTGVIRIEEDSGTLPAAQRPLLAYPGVGSEESSDDQENEEVISPPVAAPVVMDSLPTNSAVSVNSQPNFQMNQSPKMMGGTSVGMNNSDQTISVKPEGFPSGLGSQ